MKRVAAASTLAALLSVSLLAGVAGAGVAVPEGALARGAWDGEEPRVEARLLVHPDDAAGGELRAGVLFDIAPGWHIYARDPGDTGLPTRITWDVAGRAGPLAWPEPRSYREGEDALVTFGYEERVLLASVLELEPGASTSIRARVDALACAEKCIPVELELVRDLAAGEPAAADPVRALFAEAAAAVPGPPTAAPAEGGAGGLLALLGLALLGGLILNAMPCVLPVLAIKVFAIAELAQRDRAEVARHGVAYLAGVELSLLALATVVVALRGVGVSLGWGFQFQEPLFILAVCAVVLLFALNLLGAFEIGFDPGRLAGVGAQATGARRSFFEGLLAVTLATPCSAPFLGTAVGFAFAGTPGLIFAVFGCIGLGLAAPFLVVSLVPAGSRWVPRSGPWMLHVRALLGFALLATLVWLLWVLGRVTGVEGLVLALAVLWLLGLGAWLFGRFQEHGRALAGRVVVLAALALLAVATNTVSLSEAPGRDAGPVFAGQQDYRREGVQAARSAGRPAFVYFTADWCLTCKANERLVLRDPAVQAALAAHDVAVFRADWTRRDDAIRAELARFGRAGVPLYVLHGAGPDAEPRVLPELLTKGLLLAALEELDAPDAQPLEGLQAARALR